jgi:succinate dehydrogenase / fumarate reductase iron-sulfur subunit
MIGYSVEDVDPDMSFLEVLDQLNEQLVNKGQEPVAFDQDWREGIRCSCAMIISGFAHGPDRASTACQLHMRCFSEGMDIYVGPWRAGPFPIVKDLVCGSLSARPDYAGQRIHRCQYRRRSGWQCNPRLEDRSGASPECGRVYWLWRVAACPNASAMLFLAAKSGHLANLRQGQAERHERVPSMVEQRNREGFGHCTNINECEAACPKEISVEFIAQLNGDHVVSNCSALIK